jgi:hypothetical protein
MDIAFATRSRFLQDCEDAIRRSKIVLKQSGAVCVKFTPRGYDGEVVVTINPDERTAFETDWEGRDPTRFPARIKAAATALMNCGFSGQFLITHESGALKMQALTVLKQARRGNHGLQEGDSGQTVYLISCVKKKRTKPSPARELYRSDWFKKAREYVETSNCAWFVLSAKYGLVSPDQIISPYKKTLNKMLVSERKAWAEKVLRQLQKAMPQLSQVIVLAGERYREFLIPNLEVDRVSVVVPMKGLAIGQQLRWLSRNKPRWT